MNNKIVIFAFMIFCSSHVLAQSDESTPSNLAPTTSKPILVDFPIDPVDENENEDDGNDINKNIPDFSFGSLDRIFLTLLSKMRREQVIKELCGPNSLQERGDKSSRKCSEVIQNEIYERIWNGNVVKRTSVNQIQSRIVGGKPGKIEKFPYLAALLHRGIHRCGSSIINERTIITAAHCLINVILEKLQVRVGSAFAERYGIVIDVEDYHIHPNYTRLTQNFDLGLVWLKSSITYSETIQPIQLPNANDEFPSEGKKGLVAGWGRIGENKEFPDNFRYFEAPIIPREKCIKSGGGGYGSYRITLEMFCAGYLQGGQDACKADSGGPFVVDNKLIGIVSFGQGCARQKYPGVYANIIHMRSWIDDNIYQQMHSTSHDTFPYLEDIRAKMY